MWEMHELTFNSLPSMVRRTNFVREFHLIGDRSSGRFYYSFFVAVRFMIKRSRPPDLNFNFILIGISEIKVKLISSTSHLITILNRFLLRILLFLTMQLIRRIYVVWMDQKKKDMKKTNKNAIDGSDFGVWNFIKKGDFYASTSSVFYAVQWFNGVKNWGSRVYLWYGCGLHSIDKSKINWFIFQYWNIKITRVSHWFIMFSSWAFFIAASIYNVEKW